MGARLTSGEYGTPADARGGARRLFLWTVAEQVPEVLNSLRDDVLPVYVSTYSQTDGGPYLTRWRHASVVAQPLRETLEDWARPYHMQLPWVYDAALLQLDCWRQLPALACPRPQSPDTEDSGEKHPQQLKWTMLKGRLGAAFDGECRFVLEDEGWDPTWETRKEAQTRLRKAFEQRLKAYLEEIAAGMEKAEAFEQQESRPRLQQHMVWLVRYQVERDPWPLIAKSSKREPKNGSRASVSADTVARAVNDLADLLDMQLDQVRGAGRPEGSRTKNTTNNRVTKE